MCFIKSGNKNIELQTFITGKSVEYFIHILFNVFFTMTVRT